jgi:hypothetical protein
LAIDIDEYLPHDTLIWCKSQLADIGINPSSLTEGTSKPDGSRLYIEAYHRLRLTVRRHITGGNSSPRLGLVPKIKIGTEEMQRNGSRLGQLISENWEFVETIRSQQREIEGIDISREGNLSESDEEEWDEEQPDERDLLEQEAQEEE